MNRLTAEQIAAKTDHITDTEKNRAAIRKIYHAQDDSHLWPIQGKFNVTTRAAKLVSYYLIRGAGYDLAGLEYCLALENEMSNIVND